MDDATMANGGIFLTARDYEIFRMLERSPFTVRQLRALSATFAVRFGSDRYLQTRLAQLARAELLHRYRYAATARCGEFYYTLTSESFRLLHGQDAALPSLGMFREVGIARHHHTHSLAEFVVHTIVAARAVGVTIEDFIRENGLQLAVGEERLSPDTAFTLSVPSRPPFLFYVELDNSTEPLTSPRERDSWLGKLRFYEKLQSTAGSRFRVLGLITRSTARLRNIIALAASVAVNPQRSMFLGANLADFLDHATPLTSPLFTDHRGLRMALLPKIDTPLTLPDHDRSKNGSER